MFTGVAVMLYPISVVKTRLQVVSHDAVDRNVYPIIKGILKSDGISGLYKGLGTVLIGSAPARFVYITALEKSKAATSRMIEPFKLSQPAHAAIANGVGGLVSAICSQTVYVPIDVVTHQMTTSLSSTLPFNLSNVIE